MQAVNIFHRLLLLVVVLQTSVPPVVAAKKTESPGKGSQLQLEAATRLQVFLDRANFSPGKLDGHYGDFTRKALALYRQSRGEQPEPLPLPDAKKNNPPDVAGLDLASIGPAFITYEVTDEDMSNVGEIPDSVPEKAKLKALPYRAADEAIAEKFHCDRDFLGQLNPGKTKSIKAGDQLKVPNVEPFELAGVKGLKPGSEITPPVANDLADEPDGVTPDVKDQLNPGEPAPATVVNVDTKTSIVTVLEGPKLIAAYPVTIGSAQTASPVGEWKVRGVAMLPTFRYDEQMLNHGERSQDFHMLASGPNNPVGVIWIALNKKGIGLHGTEDPDSIGRSASHGCVRLANWDIVRLAVRVKADVPVSIY